jgi:hypothetical protein
MKDACFKYIHILIHLQLWSLLPDREKWGKIFMLAHSSSNWKRFMSIHFKPCRIMYPWLLVIHNQSNKYDLTLSRKFKNISKIKSNSIWQLILLNRFIFYCENSLCLMHLSFIFIINMVTGILNILFVVRLWLCKDEHRIQPPHFGSTLAPH